MATVKSLTEARILALAGQWEGIPTEQEQLEVFIAELKAALDENDIKLDQLNTETLPALQQTLEANDNKLAEVAEVTIVDLQSIMEQNQLILDGIQSVDIPNIKQDLIANIENVEARPKVFVQDEEPENPDIDDRYLLVGDTWFKPSENNKQRIWTGVEWSTMSVDVANLTVSVKQFMTSRHQIY